MGYILILSKSEDLLVAHVYKYFTTSKQEQIYPKLNYRMAALEGFLWEWRQTGQGMGRLFLIYRKVHNIQWALKRGLILDRPKENNICLYLLLDEQKQYKRPANFGHPLLKRVLTILSWLLAFQAFHHLSACHCSSITDR